MSRWPSNDKGNYSRDSWSGTRGDSVLMIYVFPISRLEKTRGGRGEQKGIEEGSEERKDMISPQISTATPQLSTGLLYRPAPSPAPMVCNRAASLGYFSCTSNCVRVASAYEMALTISASVRASSAARSKYLSACETLPCCRSSWAMVPTAISHSGSTTLC